jgi:hypothetical protein
MQTERFKSFQDFYPYYLSEHRLRGTRITHFIGTTGFLFFLLTAIFVLNGWFVLYGAIFAYGWAWIGHFFIEKNKPATFQYPLWSLLSDFKLYFEIITGKENFGQ